MARCNTIPRQNYENFRYLNKNNTGTERNLFTAYWEELVNRFGTRVEYYTYNYSLSTHDAVYGEEPTANFSGPININVMVDFPNEALLLSKFGLSTNADFTAVVTVRDFEEMFGAGSEPKAGDVIRLIEAGWESTENIPNSAEVLDHLCQNSTPAHAGTFTYTVSDLDWIRCPQLFEITEREWQDFATNKNTLLGHYVWIIRGKRFEYSYQPGITPECKQGIVGEETRTGLLSGYTQPQSPDKQYSQNITDESNRNWDYSNKGENTKVYGDY